jgi:hypothetical protein
LSLLTKTTSARLQSIAGLLLFVPIAVWLWVLIRYATNIVYNDDYALLIFIARWHDPAQSWATRLTDLVALHNTHRIIYDRLVSLGTYYLTGQLRFSVMIALGNLALAGIGWQLWRGFRQLALPVWYFLPVPFWLFSLQSHENMFWGMAALQNFTVIWFVQEALHQLHRRTPLIWPLLLSVAATLTSGNGLLAFLIGALLLISQQRRDRSVWIWLGTTAVTLFIMLGLSGVAHERTPLLTWIPNLFLATGGAFTNQTSTTLPLVGGVVLTVVMGLAILSWITQFGALGHRLRRLPVSAEWLAFGLFIMTTALLLAMHRLPDEILRDRYKLYAHLMLSLVYLLVLAVTGSRLKTTWAIGSTLLAAIMNAGAFHACLPRIVADFQQRQADVFNFQQNNTTLHIPYLRQHADSLLTSVHRQGIYQFPKALQSAATWSIAQPADSLLISSYQDDLVQNSFLGEHPCYITIDDQLIAHHLSDGTDQGIYLAVESADNRTYLFPAGPNKGSIRDFVTGKGPFRPGFSVSFLSSRLKPGNYRVNVLRVTDNRYQRLTYNQVLEIRAVY